MPIVTTKYHEIACDGTTGNLRQPACPAVSAGRWDAEADQLEQAATAAGWHKVGKAWLCPAHPVDKPAPAAKPSRTRTPDITAGADVVVTP